MGRRGTLLLAAVAVLGAGATAATLPMAGLFHPPPAWREIAWPFPRDAWPAGRAFRCAEAACGGAVEVYVRAKLGFCNCATGVSGDAEVDGVADLDMITPDFVPRGPGESAVVAGMAGRVRTYMLILPDGTRRLGTGLALSRRCDLVVAASQGEGAGSPDGLRAVRDLLESGAVRAWIAAQLGSG